MTSLPTERHARRVHFDTAYAAALAWIREAVGSYPTPLAIAVELEKVAAALRSPGDERDPVLVLGQAALDSLTAYRIAARWAGQSRTSPPSPGTVS
ncbi:MULTISPECIES: hypothetical protein [unclassified Pseudofrankia]|uniref:hypothetical protein n=1 Tax=unclassified Pseudofrankia TaxID=2994372 RepID=UPI0008D95176|nr:MULTISPECIES: hypothetical protein [unclassified Pseudofrankia]MDT3441838.1 hypothetical protein [Pseudofrankia sp. BMG5.37]OHV47115.1 hypothetical protein BCD48_20515 [Pseudofrankia sp. BMG5.36]